MTKFSVILHWFEWNVRNMSEVTGRKILNLDKYLDRNWHVKSSNYETWNMKLEYSVETDNNNSNHEPWYCLTSCSTKIICWKHYESTFIFLEAINEVYMIAFEWYLWYCWPHYCECSVHDLWNICKIIIYCLICESCTG